MEYVLKTQGLQKKYRNFTALSDVTMSVPKGSIYGFVGRNGAGKTTLIRVICGLQNPANGSYSLYGIDNSSGSIIKSRRRMGAVVETPAIYTGLSARDNLKQQYRVMSFWSLSACLIQGKRKRAISHSVCVKGSALP